MRKLKLVKVIKPELVACMIHDGETFPDYRCPECGYGIAEDYSNCPHCGAEIDWNSIDEKSEGFKKLVDML